MVNQLKREIAGKNTDEFKSKSIQRLGAQTDQGKTLYQGVFCCVSNPVRLDLDFMSCEVVAGLDEQNDNFQFDCG